MDERRRDRAVDARQCFDMLSAPESSEAGSIEAIRAATNKPSEEKTMDEGAGGGPGLACRRGIGYSPTLVGSIAGAVWALADGLVAGVLIGSLYNLFLRTRR